MHGTGHIPAVRALGACRAQMFYSLQRGELAHVFQQQLSLTLLEAKYSIALAIGLAVCGICFHFYIQNIGLFM